MSKKHHWLGPALVIGLIGGGIAGGGWYYRNHKAVTARSYQTAEISRGALLQTITAAGQLNPVLKVEVGSQISGIIQKLFADFNSRVKEGQLIAQIDPATYEANFIQAEGNLANAKAALELAQLTAERAKVLRANKLTAQAEYEQAVAGLHQCEAYVKINEGSLKKAQVDLARCKIFAPIDGIVISRDVNVGQTVAASLSAPKLFVIANDLSKMQIEAKVTEADIGQVAVDQEVKFTVDAFPGETFHGNVTQVRNAPITDQNVVTYDTIIEVSNSELKLKPGMTANVTIVMARRDQVLKIRNSALRFRPPKDIDIGKIPGPAIVAATNQKSEAATRKKPNSDKKEKRKSERTVHLLRDGAMYAVTVKTGINDGRETEVLEGLAEGDRVIVEMSEPEKSSSLMARFLATLRRKN
jgi:HlyD family secretion protein